MHSIEHVMITAWIMMMNLWFVWIRCFRWDNEDQAISVMTARALRARRVDAVWTQPPHPPVYYYDPLPFLPPLEPYIETLLGKNKIIPAKHPNSAALILLCMAHKSWILLLSLLLRQPRLQSLLLGLQFMDVNAASWEASLWHQAEQHRCRGRTALQAYMLTNMHMYIHWVVTGLLV